MADTIAHEHTTQENTDHHEKSAISSSKFVITFKLHPDSLEHRIVAVRPDSVVAAYYIPLVGPEVEIEEEELLSESEQAYSKLSEMLSLVLMTSSYRDRIIRNGISVARSKILRARNMEPPEQLAELNCVMRFCNVVWVELETEEVGMVPASKSAIEALEGGTLRNIVKQDTCEEYSCSICLEELEAESLVTRLPCNHVFHTKCITHWLNISHYCPLCRFDLP